jgi:DNA polymerase III delta prime subunit
MALNYNLSEIIGHKKQIDFLSGLYSSQRMPSGLLFYGQKNIGKNITALSFAASVLCRDYAENFKTDSSSLNFCGKCPSCLSFLNGMNQNIFTAGSSGNSIKIETIHQITSFLALKPQYPTHRFIIINDASAMNPSASNALLKILEEPQEKTVFILITSSPSMLAPTIVSRCILLSFAPIADEILSGAVKLTYPDIKADKLKIFLKLARGSYSGFIRLIEGGYLEKRDFLINNVFKKLFSEFRKKGDIYGISAEFASKSKGAKKKNGGIDAEVKGAAADEDEDEDKTYIFELILFIFRDIYIYSLLKDEEILYNEDIAGEIKKFAFESGASPEDIRHMIETTVLHIEKINGYNLNKSISIDSYFSNLISA